MTKYQWTVSFLLESFDLIAIFAKGSPLFLVLGVIVALVMMIGFIYFIKSTINTATNRQKKGKLMKEKIMPEIASKFGKVISAHGGETIRDPINSITFEREKTIFEAKIERIDIKFKGIRIKTDYEIRFNLPNLREKFYIQNKPTFFSNFSNYSSDCQPVLIPEIPTAVIFHSFNAQFLVSLLEKEQIITEIRKYPGDWSHGFRIAFENGVFIITWNFGIVEDSQIETERFEQICQTAVIFYDELKKMR